MKNIFLYCGSNIGQGFWHFFKYIKIGDFK